MRNPDNILIGLEIHVQLRTDSKLFCQCSTDYQNSAPNVNICEICSAQPGAKPMGLNKKALEAAVKIALALDCKIVNEPVIVQRKHYFYPDLPSNYQRTSKPVATQGRFEEVEIRDIHIEEDPGRFFLKDGIVDLNRAGNPLVEIVTEPAFDSPQHARKWLQSIVTTLEYLDAARQEEGTMRIDTNISTGGGARVEIKNINSFKGVETALNFEIARQKSLIVRGQEVLRETRHFEEAQGTTVSLRKKESEEDYRYFPDPDVPPVVISGSDAEKIAKSLPELPAEKQGKFVEKYNIDPVSAKNIASEIDFAEMFEEVAKKSSPELVADWFVGPLRKTLNYNGIRLKDSKVTAKNLAELFRLLENGKITDRIAEYVLREMINNPDDPADIARKLGLAEIPKDDVEKIVNDVIVGNRNAVTDYFAGKKEAFEFLVGCAMKVTKGGVEPDVIRETLKKKLR